MGVVLNGITKSFDDKTVVDDVSLKIGDNELLVLLGPSGCGKSTLLRLITGLEQQDKGEISINDRIVDKLRAKDRDVALVFQNYSLFPHMTVEANLAFPLKVAGVAKSDIKLRVAGLAKTLGLADRLTDRPSQLSGGQRQRVALGRAIIRRPALFLLDEPLSNLDAKLRTQMRTEIVQIQRQASRTMIYVTHDQAEALSMGDRIAIMDKGKIIQCGPPEELYNRPKNLFVAQFLGQPRISVVEGVVKGQQLRPFGVDMSGFLSDSSNRRVIVGIRPETISLDPASPMKGTVIRCEYLGDQYVAVLQVDNIQLTASKLSTPLQSGQQVGLSVNWERLLLFDSNTERALTRCSNSS